MDDAVAKLQAQAEKREIALAERGCRAVGNILSVIEMQWIDPGIRALHDRYDADVVAHLRDKPGFSKGVAGLEYQLMSTFKPRERIVDVTLVTNLGVFCAMACSHYVGAFPEAVRPTVRATLETAIQRISPDVVAAAQPQASVVVATMRRLYDELLKFEAKGARIILLELPVGNSIPVHILHQIARSQGREWPIVNAALSRSDAPTKGITRGQLLAERLEAFGLHEHDIIVHVDEWFTGRNIEIISTILDEHLSKRQNVWQFSVGLLIDRAKAEKKYAEYCEKHDAILKKLGQDGARWRVEVPPLKVVYERPEDHYFFWSEQDRVAGYRKMQFLGTMLATIEYWQPRLRFDPELLERARIVYLERVAKHPDVAKEFLTDEILHDHEGFAAAFEESCKAYTAVKDDLRRIADNSNDGLVDDRVQSLETVARKLDDRLKGTGARLSVFVANLAANVWGSADPENRYYLRAHAPVIQRLEGGEELLNQEIEAELQKLPPS